MPSSCNVCCTVVSLWLNNLVVAAAALSTCILTLYEYEPIVIGVLALFFTVVTMVAIYILSAPFVAVVELQRAGAGPLQRPNYAPSGVYCAAAVLLLLYPPALAGAMSWNPAVGLPFVVVWGLVAATLATWAHVRAVNLEADDDFRQFSLQFASA